MSSSLLTSLPLVLPAVCSWAEKQESIILQDGVALTEAELADARRAGVAQPEKIRVLRLEELPRPDNEEILFLAKQVGFFQTRSSGLALGYGIYLANAFCHDRYCLVHECVHVGQYEKSNGIRPFLGEYLRQCIDPGYPFGQLEQEAIRVAKDICKP
jgi:hypothetical protein